jgi:hypothetical protein
MIAALTANPGRKALPDDAEPAAGHEYSARLPMRRSRPYLYRRLDLAYASSTRPCPAAEPSGVYHSHPGSVRWRRHWRDNGVPRVQQQATMPQISAGNSAPRPGGHPQLRA